MYNKEFIKIKILNTYIKINLSNNFIKYSEFPIKKLSVFVKRFNKSF